MFSFKIVFGTIHVILMVVVPIKTNYLYDYPERVNSDLKVTLAAPRATIQGCALKSELGNTYYGFMEIPYAKPPVGDLRYKVPQKHPGWRGVLQTTRNTRVCPQPLNTTLQQSEDCLFINVFTPVKPGSNQKLAVYVWFHGGGYSFWDGAIDRYNPVYLMDYNILVVTLEYRLGALGFLATNDGVIPANLGLRDQNLALQWIQENIHLFGGDPKQVTIGGESAGSGSVSFHLVSKLSRGLFAGAILQSASCLNTFSYVPNPQQYAVQLAKLINKSFDGKNTTRLLEILKAAGVNDIIQASTKVISNEGGVGILDDLIWVPTVERQSIETPFIHRPMHEAFLAGDFAKVPQLIGFTSEEMLYFVPDSLSNNPWKLKTEEELIQKMKYFDADDRRLVNKKLNIPEVYEAYVGKLFKQIYTNSTFVHDPAAFVKLSSDFFFNHGIIRQADVSSNFLPVYLFQFDYYPYVDFGAPHTEELQYFWKGQDDRGYVNSFQLTLRHRLCKLWTNFIKCLNPTPEQDEDFGYVMWPTMSSNNIIYLNLNKTFEVRSNPRKYYEIRENLNYFIRPPYVVY